MKLNSLQQLDPTMFKVSTGPVPDDAPREPQVLRLPQNTAAPEPKRELAKPLSDQPVGQVALARHMYREGAPLRDICARTGLNLAEVWNNTKDLLDRKAATAKRNGKERRPYTRAGAVPDGLREEVRTAYGSGFAVTEIEARTGLSPTVIRALIRDLPRNRTATDDERWADARRAYVEEGLSIRLVAERYGLAPSTVSKRFAGLRLKHPLKEPVPRGMVGREPTWTPEQRDRACELWTAGYTYDAISSELGVSVGALVAATAPARTDPEASRKRYEALRGSEDNRRGRRIPADVRAAIRERLAAGERQNAVARDLGVSHGTVYNISRAMRDEADLAAEDSASDDRNEAEESAAAPVPSTELAPAMRYVATPDGVLDLTGELDAVGEGRLGLADLARAAVIVRATGVSPDVAVALLRADMAALVAEALPAPRKGASH